MKILRKKLKHIKVLASSLGIAVGVQFVAASVLLLRRFWQEKQDVPYDWKAEFNKILRTNSTITKDLVKRFVNRPEIDEIILPPNVKELGDGVFSNFKHAKILKITKETRLTIFASGIILAVSIYSVDRLINHAKLLDRANAINIIGFVFWLLYLVLASILAIIHLVRILGGKKYANNRSFYR